MKRIILMFSFLILLCGCSNINKMNYKDIINSTIKENYDNKMYNSFHNGYKYYLPKYMSIKDGLDYNEKLNNNDYTYYLYLDIVSYYNNSKLVYEENKDAYISYKFKHEDKEGYVEINKVEDDYLVEIIYNYAKIEVKVDEISINDAINNSIIILSTIKYEKDIIGNLIGENKINSQEESLNIFNKKSTDDHFLKIIEEYDTYIEEENEIPDYDVIN